MHWINHVLLLTSILSFFYLDNTLFFYFFDVHISIPRTYENTESSLLLYVRNYRLPNQFTVQNYVISQSLYRTRLTGVPNQFTESLPRVYQSLYRTKLPRVADLLPTCFRLVSDHFTVRTYRVLPLTPP